MLAFRPTNSRERLLLVIWPALLVLVGYGARLLYFPDTTAANVARLQSRLGIPAVAAARYHQAPPEGDNLLRALGQQRQGAAEARRVGQEIATLRDESAQLEAHVAELRRQLRGADNPAVAMQQLAALLSRHGLQLQRTGSAAGELQRGMPAELASVLQSPGARLWQLQFCGDFFQVQSALDELGQTALGLVPVCLTMEEGQLDVPLRVWTLVVWM